MTLVGNAGMARVVWPFQLVVGAGLVGKSVGEKDI